VSDLDGLEDQYLFDVASATKWVSTQGDVVARSDGKRVGSGVLLLYQRLKRGFERPAFARLSSRPL